MNSNAIKVGAVVAGVMALIIGLFFAIGDGDGDDAVPAAPGAAAATLTVSPNQGPDGTLATVQLQGGQPNNNHIVSIGPSSRTATTDANGDFSFSYTFNGISGQVIDLVASDASNIEVARTTFTINGDPPPSSALPTTTSTTSTIPSTDPPKPTVKLTLSPSSGTSGSSSTITVESDPNLPVAIKIRGNAQASGTTDANGDYSQTTTFSGSDGEQIAVEAIVGIGVATTTQTESFTITPTKVPTEVSLDKSSGPAGTRVRITIKGDPDSPVTLKIDGVGQSTGNTDAQGTYTFDTTMNGPDGKRIPVEATVGTGASSTATTEFEIKPATLSQCPHTFPTTFTISSDRGRHGPFVGMPGGLDLIVCEENGGLVITGPDPFVPVMGPVGDDGSFDVFGSGNVAGFPGVGVQFTGTATPKRLAGKYSLGVGGELPGGEMITFDVVSTGVIPPPVPGAFVEPDIPGFYRELSAAQAGGDTGFMVSRLHPAVINRYGEDTCRSYFQFTSNPDATFEFVEIVDRGPFDFATDGQSILIPDAYTVEVEVTVDGTGNIVESHVFAEPDGTVFWFTDCGDIP